MVSTPRWGGLRPEPYDPDAIDADNDGIVQEGTAWERPAGTRLLDELGREIIKGRISTTPLTGLQYRDRNGKVVEYTPKTPALPTGSRTPLARAGSPSLRERGMPTILDIQKQVHEARIGRLYTPPEDKPVGFRNPGSELDDAMDELRQVVDELARRRLERESRRSKRRRRRSLEEIQVERDLAAKERLSKFRVQFEERNKRVTEVYGELKTTKDARRALLEAFPNLAIGDNGKPVKGALPPWADNPWPSRLDDHEHQYLVALLAESLDNPAAAQALISITDQPAEGTGGTFAITVATVGVTRENGTIFSTPAQHRIGGGIALQEKSFKIEDLVDAVEQDSRLTRANRQVPQTIYDVVAEYKSGAIDEKEANRLVAHYVATHEYGHMIHIRQVLADRGIILENGATGPPSDEFYRQIASTFTSLPRGLTPRDFGPLDEGDMATITAVINSTQGQWDLAKSSSAYDGLTESQITSVSAVLQRLSPYSQTNEYEEFAELFALVKTGSISPEELPPEAQQLLYWLAVIQNKTARLFMAFNKVAKKKSAQIGIIPPTKNIGICTGVIHLPNND